MKRFKKSLVLLLVSFGLIFGISTQASAGTMNFRTEDGKPDNYAYPTSSKEDVQVDVWGLYQVHRGFDTYSKLTNLSYINVRLCNTSTKVCTGKKDFTEIKKGYGRVYFHNLPPGKYTVDIDDWLYDYNVKGTSFTLNF